MNRIELLKKIKEQLSGINGFEIGDEKNILCEILSISPAKMLLKDIFTDSEIKQVESALEQMKQGKPLDKILGRKNFYGREFVVTENVLTPRKETEILVEEGLKELSTNFSKNVDKIRVLDLCCGSGCCGLTIAKECENKGNVEVVLSDISSKALKVAKQNIDNLHLTNIKVMCGDMFEHLKKEEKFDIIISNPPYIKSQDISFLDKQVKDFDPTVALDGGKDGLHYYRIISKQAKDYLKNCGCVLVEIGYNQGEEVKKMFEENGFKTHIVNDYSSNDRVVVARLKD